MGMEERDAALLEFRTQSSLFISTDAGGEGLNLQFANIIINYDLPWNPMKIEQRCGRVDRIGQARDVHIYNFIVGGTVENRVREVLEEKLSVIFKELGVDKYSDVLDSEVAEMDFTEVYMRSIASPYKVDENLYPVEAEMKQQLQNARKYKGMLREDKDLSTLVGKESAFDIEDALRIAFGYYAKWKGKSLLLTDQVSITDPEVVQMLKTELLQDRTGSLLSVAIRNFPNEAGYFMLWELMLSDDQNDRKILPVFINDQFILRPMAGKRLMDVFLDGNSQLSTHYVPNIETETYDRLKEMSVNFAFDTFVEMKDQKLRKNQESYDKYRYALQLREEAAMKIGIENIRQSRIKKLENEKTMLEEAFREGNRILPEFRLNLLIRLEA